MVLLITRRIWVKLSTVFILLLRRSENILTSRLLSRLLDLLSSIDSDWPRTDKKKSGGNWVAKCDVFIVSRIIFSLVFARGRNDYISFSINIGTNKLEHDPQDTRVRFFQIFSLRVPSRRRTCQHFDIVPRATSHLQRRHSSNYWKCTRRLYWRAYGFHFVIGSRIYICDFFRAPHGHPGSGSV